MKNRKGGFPFIKASLLPFHKPYRDIPCLWYESKVKKAYRENYQDGIGFEG